MAFDTKGRPPREVSAWGAAQGNLAVRPFTDFGLVGTADDTATVQSAIDWSAANKSPVGGRGPLIIDSVTIKDGCQLLCPGPDTTQFLPLAGSTAPAMFRLDTGIVSNVKLSGFSLDARGGPNAGQHAIWFVAMPTFTGGFWQGGLWYPLFEDLRIWGFDGEGIWLHGSGDPIAHPFAGVHQFGTMRKVVVFNPSLTARALRLTGSVGQFDYDTACEFDGIGNGGSRILGTENILVERSVDVSTGINNADEAPYTHNFLGCTSQSNTRVATVQRGANILFKGGHFEGCPEGVSYETQAGGGGVENCYFGNCGHDYEHRAGSGTVTISGGTGTAAFSLTQAAALFVNASVWITGTQYFLKTFNGTNAGTLIDAAGSPAPNHAATAFDVPALSTPGFWVKTGGAGGGTETIAKVDGCFGRNGPGTVDRHFVREFGSQLVLGKNFHEGDVIRTQGVTQTAIGAAATIATFGWDTAYITATGTPIANIASALPPGHTLVLRASGGSFTLTSSGNIDLSPYGAVTVRVGGSITLRRQDLTGQPWFIVGIAEPSSARPGGIFVNHAASPYTIQPGSGTVYADASGGTVRLIFATGFADGERVTIRRVDDFVGGNAVTVEDAGGSGPDGLSPLALERAASTVDLEFNFGSWATVAMARMPTRERLELLAGSPHWMKGEDITTGGAATYWNGEHNVRLKVDAAVTNTPDTIVARDAGGDFAARDITARRIIGTADKLTTPRNINGVAFDGSANITANVPVGSVALESSSAPYGVSTASIYVLTLSDGSTLRIPIATP